MPGIVRQKLAEGLKIGAFRVYERYLDHGNTVYGQRPFSPFTWGNDRRGPEPVGGRSKNMFTGTHDLTGNLPAWVNHLEENGRVLRVVGRSTTISKPRLIGLITGGGWDTFDLRDLRAGAYKGFRPGTRIAGQQVTPLTGKAQCCAPNIRCWPASGLPSVKNTSPRGS